MCDIENFVPKDAVHLYKMLWQFEKWLRLMVYVELYARDNNWEKAIAPHKKNDKEPTDFEKAFPPKGKSTDGCNKDATANHKKDNHSPKSSDKKLTHMVTAHQSSLSYLSLGELWDIICNNKNWRLFEKYFPPKDNTDARIKEIKNIRNRIMHFREPHENDVIRMLLFLKDFEAGVRLFCQSYRRQVFSDKEDELIRLLSDCWINIGHEVELHHYNHGYLYALQPHRRNPKIYATLRLILRPWGTSNGEGHLYEISICSLRNAYQNNSEINCEDPIIYELDFEKMLMATEDVHNQCLLILIKGNGEFSAVFPAHLGVETNFITIDTILSAGINCSKRPQIHKHEIERLSRQTPEYVLWPGHPLFRYDDSMTESLIFLD